LYHGKFYHDLYILRYMTMHHHANVYNSAILEGSSTHTRLSIMAKLGIPRPNEILLNALHVVLAVQSLCSASHGGCKRDTARNCCQAPYCCEPCCWGWGGALSSKPPQAAAAVDRWDRQTDRQTDGRIPTQALCGWRRSVVVSGVRRMNEVNARWARLIVV